MALSPRALSKLRAIMVSLKKAGKVGVRRVAKGSRRLTARKEGIIAGAVRDVSRSRRVLKLRAQEATHALSQQDYLKSLARQSESKSPGTFTKAQKTGTIALSEAIKSKRQIEKLQIPSRGERISSKLLARRKALRRTAKIAPGVAVGAAGAAAFSRRRKRRVRRVGS